MSHRVKSNVRLVESGRDRRHDDDDDVESRRIQPRFETKRLEKEHVSGKNNERHYHRDHAGHRKRRHRNNDVTDGQSRNERDDVRERSRYNQEEDSKGEKADDTHTANDTSERRVEYEHQKDSQTEKDNDEAENDKYMKAKRAKVEDTLTTRTGGAYIPPARLKMMQDQISDKASVQYQRLSWEALKKSINGLINKANVSNLVHVVHELFQENIVRGRMADDKQKQLATLDKEIVERLLALKQ